MKRITIVLLCLLIACVPVSEPAPSVSPVQPEIKQPVLPVVEEKLITEPATRTVKQTGSLGTFIYGLTEDNRVISIDKTGAEWKFIYENGRLSEISGSLPFS